MEIVWTSVEISGRVNRSQRSGERPAGGQFPIDDTYWTEEDYRGAPEQAGFTVATVDYPRPRDPAAWSTDEATVPPFIVIKAIKQAVSGPAAEIIRGKIRVPMRIRYERSSSGLRPLSPALAAKRPTSRIYLSSGRDHQVAEEAIEGLLDARSPASAPNVRLKTCASCVSSVAALGAPGNSLKPSRPSDPRNRRMKGDMK